MDELSALLARERRRVVALLARRLGLAHWALAEDAVQTASLRALERWPLDGVPQRPAAWLFQVARHAAIDALRAQGRDVALPEDETELPVVTRSGERLQGELDDDELALLFAACHPKLPPATQLLLALRLVSGLELAQLAPLLFSSEAALAQRLARARQLLVGESLTVPAGSALPPRRDAVLATLALAFHAGQIAAGRAGGQAGSSDAVQLCWEAIRLARALAAHPASRAAEADALAALLLLHGARLSGRIDAAGDIVALPGQARERWDGGLIRLGFAHLAASQRGELLSRWHLLAGIAGEHARAPDYARTDWAAILRYYALLLPLDPSPAPRLGQAIALAEAGEPEQALQHLQALSPPAALLAHHRAALARACERAGELPAARHWLAEAVLVAPHAADARLLQRRLDALG